MSRRRRAAVGLGVVVSALGLLMAVSRGVVPVPPVKFAVVTLLGVLAVVQGLRYALARWSSPPEAAETGDPERRYEAPTPGADVDETLAAIRGWSPRQQSTRERLTTRLTETATRAIADAEGCTRGEARTRLRDGSWTDDPVAAWFLGENVDLPRSIRARLLVRRGGAFQLGFERAVAAVEAVGEGER